MELVSYLFIDTVKAITKYLCVSGRLILKQILNK
jgi:hypothetical protein